MAALRPRHLLLATACAALAVTAVVGVGRLAPPAEARVTPRVGFHATVAGWTSWYGSYDLGALGPAWCIDHGLRAPDPALGLPPDVAARCQPGHRGGAVVGRERARLRQRPGRGRRRHVGGARPPPRLLSRRPSRRGRAHARGAGRLRRPGRGRARAGPGHQGRRVGSRPPARSVPPDRPVERREAEHPNLEVQADRRRGRTGARRRCPRRRHGRRGRPARPALDPGRRLGDRGLPPHVDPAGRVVHRPRGRARPRPVGVRGVDRAGPAGGALVVDRAVHHVDLGRDPGPTTTTTRGPAPTTTTRPPATTTTTRPPPRPRRPPTSTTPPRRSHPRPRRRWRDTRPTTLRRPRRPRRRRRRRAILPRTGRDLSGVDHVRRGTRPRRRRPGRPLAAVAV